MNLAVVKADSAACAGQIENAQSSVGIGDTFVYSIGTMGAASNNKIFDINYRVTYDSEYVNIVGGKELEITSPCLLKLTIRNGELIDLEQKGAVKKSIRKMSENFSLIFLCKKRHNH